jgi:hypothetical protein
MSHWNNLCLGEYRNGKKHGHGTYTYANGDCYQGEYQLNKRHGYGKFTNRHGYVYVGMWENDRLVVPDA